MEKEPYRVAKELLEKYDPSHAGLQPTTPQPQQQGTITAGSRTHVNYLLLCHYVPKEDYIIPHNCTDDLVAYCQQITAVFLLLAIVKRRP